jgi:hypothetical protein
MGNIPFCNTALTSLEVNKLYNLDSTQAWWDQITLLQSSSTPVVITPSTSGTFTRGTWSGSVTLTQGGTNLMLTATDNAGHTGTSNPFDAGGASDGGTNSTSATNQAPRIKGTYTGLFFQSNAVAQQSSGFFSLNATASGSFSGTLQNGGTRYPLSGKFDTNTGHATVTNRPHSLTPLLVDLQLDMTQGTDRLSGMVSNSLWTSQLAGDRATFNAKTNPAPQAGQYTLIIPGSPGSTTEPAGDGFGVVTIYSSGQIRFAGSLSDGTKISQTTLLSKYGQWPLYVSLYSGKGSILSWLTVTNPPEGGLGGDLVWVKPLSSAKLYPGGFALEPAVFGSSYSPPGTNKVITLTDAEVVLTDGNLTNYIAGQFTLGAKSRVTTTNKLTLSFTQSSGLFKGNLRTADHPKSISFSGVVLQNQTNGSGYFLGTNQSGRIVLQGD